ncbi:MAG: serine/threonine-protein kinase, partial [Thermosynechococcaceae cyanobacterium]
IKPSNIFVTHNESLGELAKLLDFGIADFLSQSAKDRPSQPFMGTLAYGSPEQISGQRPDMRSDIYSLGITMFESLTGTLPIRAETDTFDLWLQAHCQQPPQTFAKIAPNLALPKPLEEVIMACLAKQPEQRPQTVEEIRDRLNSIGQSISGTSETVPPEDTIPELAKLAAQPQAQQQERSRAYETLVTFESAEDIAWQSKWPANTPNAEITFPRTLRSPKQDAASLWVMLSRDEIQQRMLHTRHCHFLCTFAPHPMLLWVTSFFSKEEGAKWMPCYVDLKANRGRQITQLLSSNGYFHLLLFALEAPGNPSNVVTITIPEKQRKNLSDWLTTAHGTQSTAAPEDSKKILRAQYETVKAKIQMRV